MAPLARACDSGAALATGAHLVGPRVAPAALAPISSGRRKRAAQCGALDVYANEQVLCCKVYCDLRRAAKLKVRVSSDARPITTRTHSAQLERLNHISYARADLSPGRARAHLAPLTSWPAAGRPTSGAQVRAGRKWARGRARSSARAGSRRDDDDGCDDVCAV